MPLAGTKAQSRKQDTSYAYTHVSGISLPHPNTPDSAHYLQTSPEALLSGYQPFQVTLASSYHQNGVELVPPTPSSASPVALNNVRTRPGDDSATKEVDHLRHKRIWILFHDVDERFPFRPRYCFQRPSYQWTSSCTRYTQQSECWINGEKGETL